MKVVPHKIRTVELKSQITLKYTAKADLYNVSTSDINNHPTLTLVPGVEKINFSATKTINDDIQLNKYDKVTILVKKQSSQA